MAGRDAWLGGGTYLFSVPQPKLTRLLDLEAFGWTPIEEKPDVLWDRAELERLLK